MAWYKTQEKQVTLRTGRDQLGIKEAFVLRLGSDDVMTIRSQTSREKLHVGVTQTFCERA